MVKGIVVNQKYLKGSELEIKSQKEAKIERESLIQKLKKQLNESRKQKQSENNNKSSKSHKNKKKHHHESDNEEEEEEEEESDDGEYDDEEEEILDEIEGLETMNNMEYRPLIYDFIIIDTPVHFFIIIILID